MKNYAYITALTNEKYLPGVLTLANSLKRVESKYPLYILAPDDCLPDLELRIKTDKIAGVIRKPNIRITSCLENMNSYWEYTFFKLQVPSCTQFEKIILIDSDMLVQRNIDHLFQRPHYSAVVAGKTRRNDWVKLNSGLLVLEPNNELADILIKNIDKTIRLRASEGRNCGDQDVFQQVFPDWENHGELEIEEVYNCFCFDIPKVCKAYKCKPQDLYVIHFIGEKKPWNMTRKDIIRVISIFIIHKNISSVKILLRYLNLIKKGMA